MNCIKHFLIFAIVVVSVVFAAENAQTSPLTIDQLKKAMEKCKGINEKGIYLHCLHQKHIEFHVAEAAFLKKDKTETLSDSDLTEIINTDKPPLTAEIGVLGYVFMGFVITAVLALATLIVHVTTKKKLPSTDI